MINTASYLKMIHYLLDQHDFPRDKFMIVPDLECAGMSWEGSIVIREQIGEEEGLPILTTDSIRRRLINDYEMRIACLILHEMYHCRYHFTPVNQLSGEERLARDLDADEWALKQMGLTE